MPITSTARNGACLYQTSIVDLSERKRAEEALRTKEAELKAVINRTPFMLTRCSRDLHYRFVSRAYAEMLDRAPEEIVPGKPLFFATAFPLGGYGLGIGTSQAAAHVTGSLALVLQLQRDLSFNNVLALLQHTANSDGVPSDWEGAGVIDAERIVDVLKGALKKNN